MPGCFLFGGGVGNSLGSKPSFLLLLAYFGFIVFYLFGFLFSFCCEKFSASLSFSLASLSISISLSLSLSLYLFLFSSLLFFLSSSLMFCIYLLLSCFGVSLSWLVSLFLFHEMNFGGCLSFLDSFLVFH